MFTFTFKPSSHELALKTREKNVTQSIGGVCLSCRPPLVTPLNEPPPERKNINISHKQFRSGLKTRLLERAYKYRYDLWCVYGRHQQDLKGRVFNGQGRSQIFIRRGYPSLLILLPSASFPSPPCLLPFLPSLPLSLLPFHPPFPSLPPLSSWGSGEACKLPAGPGGARPTSDFLANLEHKIKHLTTTILTGFLIN